MRVLLQRVNYASVTVDGELKGEIGKGVLLFIGVTHTDTEKDAVYLAEKIANLRIFEDEDGKMNRSVLDIGGGALVISQFTLYGDCRKGRRPGFSEAADPAMADPLYMKFTELLRQQGVSKVDHGVFGADMKVKLENDGPVTFIVESK
ncbi:MAG: D-tyrosyl-tRNA(Tyr) deacylase [Lentisphaeria bacterium]|nr:D-tyrosyl-tRNA(Tyr) deacylase [Lentisphaeria bacterium]